MHRLLIYLPLACITISCQDSTPSNKDDPQNLEFQLTLEQAEKLANLPLDCITKPLPYKSGLTIAEESDLAMPIVHHPAFYGCFDWHSSVHGHWSLVYLLKHFPEMNRADEARNMVDSNITDDHIQKEIEYFSLNPYSTSFERTYGWAWLLKLTEELYTWNDSKGQQWYNTLKPLSDFITEQYIDYLPKLVYPIRVGEHNNTAFGLTFAWDYANTTGNQSLLEMIEQRARDFYLTDRNCPVNWEPSGYDFLSPCLEEMDLMRRVLSEEEFDNWSTDFLPGLLSGNQTLTPGEVRDRSDGKLVHLDGLNFSRAWCLYPLHNPKLTRLADQHFSHSIDKIFDGDYAGGHWLASFALYALQSREKAIK